MYAECFPALIEKITSKQIEKGISLLRFDGVKTYKS
jgi:hypothetical protein